MSVPEYVCPGMCPSRNASVPVLVSEKRHVLDVRHEGRIHARSLQLLTYYIANQKHTSEKSMIYITHLAYAYLCSLSATTIRSNLDFHISIT